MSAHISHENMITFLLTTPMFEDLEPREIGEIIHIVETIKYAAGDVIFREGEAGDGWYALYGGEVEVVKQFGNTELSIRTLGPHSCFGEIAVLDGLPRSASIRAVKESVVLRIPQNKFRGLLDADHLVAHKLIEHMALLLAGRQRSGTEALSSLLKANDLAHIHEGIRQLIGEASIRE